MTARSLLQVFENYQKARLAFVQTVADLALRSQNNEVMKKSNVLGKFPVGNERKLMLIEIIYFRSIKTACERCCASCKTMRCDCLRSPCSQRFGYRYGTHRSRVLTNFITKRHIGKRTLRLLGCRSVF